MISSSTNLAIEFSHKIVHTSKQSTSICNTYRSGLFRCVCVCVCNFCASALCAENQNRHLCAHSTCASFRNLRKVNVANSPSKNLECF